MMQQKMLKRNIVISGTLGTDLNSEVLSRGIKKESLGKQSSYVSNLAQRVQAGPSVHQELGEQGKNREVEKYPQQLERPYGQSMLRSVSSVFFPHSLGLNSSNFFPPF